MPKKDLIPGTTVRYEFPRLPKTLHALTANTDIPACMQVCLPANYTTSGVFPILVFIQGGTGAYGDTKDADHVRRIAGDDGIIGVSLPLFKKEVDPKEVHAGIMIEAYDDYPIISESYRVMLTRLFKAIPNIDHGKGSIGGFSNGGHTTALLLSAVDPFILKHFSNYFMVDGGNYLASMHKTIMKEKNILYLIGGDREESDRRTMLQHIEDDCAEAKGYGVNITLITMPGVGHAFPEKYFSTLRDWVRSMLAKGQTGGMSDDGRVE
ncbi:MAG: hypothetical protein AABZ39_06585 [Spirochaetota bacterium]